MVSKFKASVVKFDVAYPYGEKHEEFEKLSETLAFNPDILVATVGVKDYGEKENLDLARKYKVNKEDYPVVLLFTKGSLKPTRFQVSKVARYRFIFYINNFFFSTNLRKRSSKRKFSSVLFLQLVGCGQD